MSNIAKELRERSLQAEQEGEPLSLLDDAADEIERLRLTDEEREAVEVMERVANRTETLVVGIGPRHAKRLCGPAIAATLLGLLKRLG